MDELCDFFPAQNRRQRMGLFRIGSVGKVRGSTQRLDVEKAQSRQMLSYGIRRQLAFLKQLSLILTNVLRT